MVWRSQKAAAARRHCTAALHHTAVLYLTAAVRKRVEKKSMSNILIRLRQACNHPYLLPGQEPEVGGRMGGREPLSAGTVMPRLFSLRLNSPLLFLTVATVQEFKDPERSEDAWRFMVAASGKLSVLQQMLPRLLAGGHRVLIFSQSVEVRRGVVAVVAAYCYFGGPVAGGTPNLLCTALYCTVLLHPL